jgi:hypothetical protein
MMKLLPLLLLVATIAHADQYDRDVDIVNNTGLTLQRFWASNIDAGSWEEDMLGDQTIAPHSRVTATIDDGSGYCLYDLKALMSDGQVEVRYNVNVCEVSQWTIYN